MDDESRLIQFRPRPELADEITSPFVLRKRHWEDCKHWPVELDLELRAVFCTACGERLDPIQVLLEYNTYWERFAREFAQLKQWKQEERERAAERSRKQQERWEKQRAKREVSA